MKRGLQIIFATLAILVGLYPAGYFILERTFGLLSTKPLELLSNYWWNLGFYTHIVLGGVSLLIGWMQFIPSFRNTYPEWHRRIGKIYLVSVGLSALAAIGIAFFATGGWISSLGFISLGIIWLYTTITAYLHIRQGQVLEHEKMMVYSYAACFAAVTLRIWLPLLVFFLNDFVTAYRIVAWLCWAPNIVTAWAINRK